MLNWFLANDLLTNSLCWKPYRSKPIFSWGGPKKEGKEIPNAILWRSQKVINKIMNQLDYYQINKKILEINFTMICIYILFIGQMNFKLVGRQLKKK